MTLLEGTASRADGHSIRWGGLAAALVGALCAVPVHAVGRLYVGEVVLAGLAMGTPILWSRMRSIRQRRWLGAFLILGGGYLASLVATDVYRAAAPNDYLRGWFRAVLMFGDVLGLLVLVWERPQRTAYWLGGWSVGFIVIQALQGVDVLGGWKFGLALPLTILALLTISEQRPKRLYSVLAVATLVHLLLDYRSMAGFCLLTALLTYTARRRRLEAGPLLTWRSGFVAIGAAGVFGAVYVTGFGLEGSADDVLQRRAASNIQRIAGVAIGLQVVARSPLVGYGSWPRSDDVFASWVALQSDLGSPASPANLDEYFEETGEGGLIRTHSQVLQAWVEAGLPGALFFVTLTAGLARLTWVVMNYSRVSRLTHLHFFWSAWTVWALLLSPFGGIVRLQNAVGLALAAVCGLAVIDQRARRRAQPATHQARW